MMENDKDIAAAVPAELTLRNALERIARWHGEFPRVPDRQSESGTISYSMAYGSNGERDFMRQVALDALAAAPSPAPVPESQAGDDLRYATELARAIWVQHYFIDAPDWEPMESMHGVLSQIDNMVTGLSRSAAPVAAESEGWIAVADRMPAEWEMVLTCGSKKVEQAVMAWSNHSGWQIETTNEWHDAYAPTHWRPLPSLPAAPLTAPKG